MKFVQKSVLSALLLSGVFFASQASAYVLDFENYISGTNTYAQGTVPDGTAATVYTYQHTLSSACGTISLNSDWSDWGSLYGRPVSWSWSGGFTISNVNAEDTTNPRTSEGKSNGAYVYTNNTYAAAAGAGNYPADGYNITVSGAESSASYAVMFGSSARGTTGGTVTFENPVSVTAFDFTNTVGALNVVTFGDTFSAKANPNNWAAVIVRGWNPDGILVGQKTLLLYDYLTENRMVTDWTEASLENITLKVFDAAFFGVDASDSSYVELAADMNAADTLKDFSTLTERYAVGDYGSFQNVSKLTFSFDGSDEGNWGFNFPTYFALDNLRYDYDLPPEAPLPEPSAWLLALLFLPILWKKKK